ncbi:protease complex subunit PrcB family protein [Marinimicrobium koreense]|uniref:protease complex subunit PrcB family protein n=1 Tax=Marinimicrobium koreense TaxID=306545 RepID=UPI003F6FD689
MELVTNAHRFRELYLAANPDSQDDVPEIDFHERDVIAVLAGRKSSGGHAVYVSEVNERDGDLDVVYTLVSPSSDCAVTPPPNHLSLLLYLSGKSSGEGSSFRSKGVGLRAGTRIEHQLQVTGHSEA